MVDLQDKHSFSLPAKSAHLVTLRHLADIAALEWRADSFILGEGSNTVFLRDFTGHLILNQLKGFIIVEEEDAFGVEIAGGENWHSCVAQLISQGIYGLENLALIPGSVGAAPIQNIGAYGVEVSEFIEMVHGVDLTTHRPFQLSHAECQFGYRDSVFKRPECNGWLITKVSFRFPKAWQPKLNYPDLTTLPATASAMDIFNHVVKVRQQKLPDPKILPNAGSFFKNPIISVQQCRRLRKRYPDIRFFELPDGQCKLAAAWLIDQAGLKSLRVGGAGVHQRQALVLVNLNKATGDDLIQLAQQVCKQIKQRFDVILEPEVRLLGSSGLIEL